MNIGRFIDVHYAENNEGTYNISELGIYFEDTTDEALNSLIEGSLCFLGADGEPPLLLKIWLSILYVLIQTYKLFILKPIDFSRILAYNKSTIIDVR